MVSSKEDYKPNPQDVVAVKGILLAVYHHIPIDLVDLIIDFAEYWPRISTALTTATRAQGRYREHVFVMRSKPLCVGACEGDETSAAENVPEPALEYPARRIVWTIRSHDQGYSGEAPHTKGTYASSWTGFDAGVERFHPAKALEATPYNRWTSSEYLAAWPGQATHDPCGEPLIHEWPRGSKPDAFGPPLKHPDEAHYAVPDPPLWPRRSWHNGEMQLQCNVQAKSAPTEHVIVWDWTDDLDPESAEAREVLGSKGRGAFTGDGRLVRSLQRGDCVALWAHAFFPGWVNYIESAKIDVYFAI